MNMFRLISVIITLLVVLSSCSSKKEVVAQAENQTSPTAYENTVLKDNAESLKKLNFSVVAAKSPGSMIISQEELGNNADISITYVDLTEVNIVWNSETTSLPAAIKTGKLTIPEIFAFARLDAHNGFCQESYHSDRGLTHFVYTYPECELEIVYDVYETPNGKQSLINTLSIYSITDAVRSVSDIYVDETNEWGYFIDREDWGLYFEVSKVSPTQITINYFQTQNHEIGELTLDDYTLYAKSEDDSLDIYLARSKRDTKGFPISIQSNASGTFVVDWTDIAGALEPGEYYLKLTISDNYDDLHVHPLMVNYYDKQSYHIQFTIE